MKKRNNAFLLKAGFFVAAAIFIALPSISSATTTVTPSVIIAGKTYDGTTTATVALCTLSGVQLADIGRVSCSASSATFDTKDAGFGKTVTATGITLSGSKAGLYALSSTTATTTASISKRPLEVIAALDTKAYDGTANGTVTPTVVGTIAPGDTANFTESYPNKNAGSLLTMTPSGSVSDGFGGNDYDVNFTANPLGFITKRALTITATGVDKIFDGTTSATVTLSDNHIAGDDLTTAYTSASFADAAVGNNKPVSVTGISVSGADVGNYTTPASTASTTANITAVDTTAPVVTVNSVTTANPTPTITGSVDDSTATVSVTVNGASYTAVVTGNTWSAAVTAALTPDGPYPVSVTATDAAGNIGTASGTVTINSSLPTLSIDAIATNATVITGITDEGNTVTVNIDSGTPMNATVTGGTWSISVPTGLSDGLHLASATATNTLGTTATANENFTVDTVGPVLTLPSDMTVEATGANGATVSFTATATDATDGSVTPECTPASGTTFALGATTVTCTAHDASGNNAEPGTFTVTVSDTTAPVITLNGDSAMTVSLNGTYAEAGATAADAVDGTDSVTVGGDTVNTAVAGTYVVTYDAVDAAGNHATQVTRTVIVSGETNGGGDGGGSGSGSTGTTGTTGGGGGGSGYFTVEGTTGGTGNTGTTGTTSTTATTTVATTGGTGTTTNNAQLLAATGGTNTVANLGGANSPKTGIQTVSGTTNTTAAPDSLAAAAANQGANALGAASGFSFSGKGWWIGLGILALLIILFLIWKKKKSKEDNVAQ